MTPDRDNILTLARARVICGMEEVCYGEGTGPDAADLMRLVFALYPELRAEFRLAAELYPEEK